MEYLCIVNLSIKPLKWPQSLVQLLTTNLSGIIKRNSYSYIYNTNITLQVYIHLSAQMATINFQT